MIAKTQDTRWRVPRGFREAAGILGLAQILEQPLQIVRAARFDRQNKKLGRAITMQCGQSRLQRRQLFDAGFDQEHGLAHILDFALPSINRANRGEQCRACRQLFFDERERKPLSLLRRCRRGENDAGEGVRFGPSCHLLPVYVRAELAESAAVLQYVACDRRARCAEKSDE